MCNFENEIWSEPPLKKVLILIQKQCLELLSNTGYTQLQESCAAINIQCMGKKAYAKMHENVTEAFAKAAEESMRAAANEERELAIQHNDIINGVPDIAVIGDGSWMKKSYRTGRYDSLSGVGTIYGANR